MSNYYDYATNPQTFAPTNPNMPSVSTFQPGAPPPGWEPQQAPSAESSLSQGNTPLSPGKEEFLRQEQEAMQEQRQTQQQLVQAGQQQVAQMQADAKRNQQLYDSLARSFVVPQPPQSQAIPKAPTFKDAQAQDPNQMWLTAAMFLGTLGGALTRRPITNALSAFTGIIEGYNQGQNQNFERLSKQWEMANKEALEKQAESEKHYQQILESTRLGVEQKQIAIQVEGMRQRDQAMIAAAQTKNLEVVAQLQDQRARYAGELYKAAEAKDTAMERAEYQRQTQLQVAQVRAAGAGQQRRDEDLQYMVDRDIAGDTSATKGMSVRSPDWPRYQQLYTDTIKARGLTPQDILDNRAKFAGETSYQRTAGTQGARVESATNEIIQVAPLAVQASHNLDRSDWVPYNRAVQEGLKLPGVVSFFLGADHLPFSQKDFSDPRYYDFAVRNYTLARAYARAMNPTGQPRVSDAEHAMQMLSTATSQRAYDVQVRALLDEVQASQRAVEQTRAGQRPNTGSLADQLGLPRSTDPMPQTGGGGIETMPHRTWGDWVNSKLEGWKVTPSTPSQTGQ
jgi:hypothetical protein